MNKIEEEEILNKTISEVTSNIEILMAGGMLTDEHGNVFDSFKIVMKNDDQEAEIAPKEFSKFVEYIIPKTAREIELEAMFVQSQAENAQLREQIADTEHVPPTAFVVTEQEDGSKLHRDDKEKLEYAKLYLQATLDNGGKAPIKKIFAEKHKVRYSTMCKIIREFTQLARIDLAKHPGRVIPDAK